MKYTHHIMFRQSQIQDIDLDVGRRQTFGDNYGNGNVCVKKNFMIKNITVNDSTDREKDQLKIKENSGNNYYDQRNECKTQLFLEKKTEGGSNNEYLNNPIFKNRIVGSTWNKSEDDVKSSSISHKKVQNDLFGSLNISPKLVQHLNGSFDEEKSNTYKLKNYSHKNIAFNNGTKRKHQAVNSEEIESQTVKLERYVDDQRATKTDNCSTHFYEFNHDTKEAISSFHHYEFDICQSDHTDKECNNMTFIDKHQPSGIGREYLLSKNNYDRSLNIPIGKKHLRKDLSLAPKRK